MHAIATTDDKEIRRWRERLIEEGKQPTWDALSTVDKRRLSENEILRELEEEYKVYANRSAQGDRRQLSQYWEAASSHDHSFHQNIASIERQFERGAIDATAFRRQVGEQLTYRREAKRNLIENRFPGIGEYFVERRVQRIEGEGEGDVFYGDLVYDQYLVNVILNERAKDAEGNFNGREYQKLIQEFRSKITESDWEYVQKRKDDWMRFHPLVKEYETSKDTMNEYWNIHRKMYAIGSTKRRVAVELLSADRQYIQGQMMMILFSMKGGPLRKRASVYSYSRRVV